MLQDEQISRGKPNDDKYVRRRRKNENQVFVTNYVDGRVLMSDELKVKSNNMRHKDDDGNEKMERCCTAEFVQPNRKKMMTAKKRKNGVGANAKTRKADRQKETEKKKECVCKLHTLIRED